MQIHGSSYIRSALPMGSFRELESNAHLNKVMKIIFNNIENNEIEHHACNWLEKNPQVIDDVSFEGRSILQYAIILKMKRLTNYLLFKGADVNFKSINNCTPLMFAIRNNDLKLVKCLVSNHDADIHVVTSFGISTLELAIDHGYSDIVLFLLEQGADYLGRIEKFKVEKFFDTVFECYIESILNNDSSDKISQHYILLKILIEKGVKVDRISLGNRNPIGSCAKYNLLDLARLLIAAGANINAQDRNGDTPLILSVKYDARQMTSLLLQCGAKEKLANKEGGTALQVFNKKNLALRVYGREKPIRMRNRRFQ